MFILQIARTAISSGSPAGTRKESSMTSGNCEAVTRMVAAFNDRDWDGVRAEVAEDCIFSDPTQDHKGPDGFIEGYNKTWVAGFSDAEMTDVMIHDAGDTVIVEFLGVGTNDGSVAGLPPTGKHASQRICEVYRFDSDGKVIAGRAYYDQLGVLEQLGHAEN
jgi:steroid delta-isomerase-like uncharacterized protein